MKLNKNAVVLWRHGGKNRAREYYLQATGARIEKAS
jgi:hypothetical protein